MTWENVAMETTLVVGTSKGLALLRSSDRKSWSFDGLALQGWKVTASARDDKGRTYLGVCQDIFGPAIVYSDDLKTWTQLEDGPSYAKGTRGNALHARIAGSDVPMGDYDMSQRQLDQIWKLHFGQGRLFAGVSEAGLFVSDDQGATWQPVEGLNDHPTREEWEPGAGGMCLHTILTDETNPDRMWIGISAAGVFRTDDGGLTWMPKNDGVDQASGICVHALTHDPHSPDVVYRQDHRGVYISKDGGDSWTIAETGLPRAKLSDDRICSFGFPVGFDPKSNSAFVVPLDGDGLRIPKDGKIAIYRTQNGGETWTSTSNGLPHNIFASVLRGAMAVDAHDPAGVYFGTSSGNVFASPDLGENWQEIPASLPRVLSVEAYVS